ncbi:histidine kinase [Acidovorax delafieldii 2AN]|uniref:histidine kinase n=1 Tax=Acidovorax delafieldii 2AN TaxID=573060 RepID=C5T9R9_ACIDE|nr:hybrid sensor histidine kinase/response regulator [Acidovorax delafieldii]EER58777.1 histidine kinase [Acidovorax delafieldii 2AN]
MASEGAGTDSLLQRVEVERIDMLYRHTRTTLATNVLLASAVVGVLWTMFPPALLLGWWGAIVALVLVRLGLVRGYRHREPAQARRWAHYLTWATLLSGAAWGASGVAFFAPQSVVALSFVTIILAGIAAGSVPAYASWPQAQYSAIPTVLPMAGRFLVEGGEWVVMGLIGVLYLYNVQSSARQLAKVIEESIRLRLEKQALAQRLGEEKQVVEAAHRAKTQFLAAASHDLRQPLQAVHLLIEVLRRTPDPAQSALLIERLAEAAGALDEVLDELLDMSRLQAGLMMPHKIAFPLNDLLSRLDGEMRLLADKKGLELCFVPTRAWVYSDPQMLLRMLRNLVSNAVHHTAQGRVLVGCRQRGGEIGVMVCDTGPGIAPEHHTAIFREFYQLDNPERDRRKGLGLGLAIVAGLCRLLEHRVLLKSVLGRGSCFELRVPQVQPAALPEAAHLQGDTALAGCVVLVIDDDPGLRETLGSALEVWGCTAVAADGVQAALATLASRRLAPDLIVADYRLRNQATGIEAIAAVRQALGRQVPAAILTGDTAPQRLKEAAGAGHLLLHKPVQPASLRAALAKLRQGAS